MQAPFADPLLQLDSHQAVLPLVDRTNELQVVSFLLNTVLLDLPTGARALTITGETGIGKSRLLAEMYTEARKLGFRVLEGRIYVAGNVFPYFPFIEALRPALRSSTTAQLRYYLGLANASVPAPSDGDRHFDTAAEREQSIDISPLGLPLVAALAQLFPELPGLLGVTVVPEVLTADQQKFRLLDAVATFLERMALEQPILLSIDDLQWADSASFELTLYLSVRLHKSRVALVGATRPLRTPTFNEGEEALEPATTTANRASAQALGELMRQGLLLVLPLGPLDAASAAQHLHALLPGTIDESLEQALLARAEGNPFFLEELVRTLILSQRLVQRGGSWQTSTGSAPTFPLPDSIIAAVGQRLQEISPACRELLRIAALCGRRFPLAALQQVITESGTWHPQGVPLDVVAPLVGARLPHVFLALIGEAAHANIIALAPSPSGDEEIWQGQDIDRKGRSSLDSAEIYLFNQGIVQEVLSTQLPPQRANALHALLGRALESVYAATASAHAAELARHYLLGGNTAAALHWNLLAGEDAAQKQTHREAIAHFRQVLKLIEGGEDSFQAPSIPELLITIGDLWFKLGELEQAARCFQQALERLREAPGSAHLQLAQANRLLADVYRMQGKYDLAMAHLQATRAALETSEMPASQEVEYVPWFPGRGFSLARGSFSLARINTSERLLFLQSQAMLDIFLNHRQKAEAALWQVHQLATEIGDRSSQAFALHFVSWLRGWGVHIREAIRLQEQAREIYIAIGDPFRAALGDQGLGIIYQGLGETERASLYTLRGLERARRYAVRYSLGWLYWNSGTIALTRGDWTASTTHFEEALREAEATNNARLKPITLQAQAVLAFRQGNWQRAERLFQEAIQTGLNTEWYPSTLALYGHFLAVTGRRAAARTQLDKAAAHPELPGYGGDFYIPFLAEGYIHIEANTEAAAYIERIRDLRGFMYYGSSVDRILGVVAAQSEQWELAEQAFEDGLTLCRRADNQPEEAAILYEEARTLFMQSGLQPGQQRQMLSRVHKLCDQARNLFLHYNMQRSVNLLDTFQDGVRQLAQRPAVSASPLPASTSRPRSSTYASAASSSEYQLDLNLTKREQEVLRLVAEGHTDREVAEILVLSPRTVNRHLSNIFVKLDVPGRAAAVAYAIRQGMV